MPHPQWLCREELAAEGAAVPRYTPALLASVACKARELVAAAVARGWAATTEVRPLADGCGWAAAASEPAGGGMRGARLASLCLP